MLQKTISELKTKDWLVLLACASLFLTLACIDTDEDTKATRRKVVAREVANSVKIVDYNWHKDPTFGGDGTIKWNVQVKNISSKYVENVKVEFTTYEAGGRMISTTFTYVSAIPPGESRASQSYADLYGAEARATCKLARVHFAR